MRGASIALLVSTLSLNACSSGPPNKGEPFGVLPSAVTTAEPLWIPFSIGAGQSVTEDARETKLASLRQLTTDGKSWGAVWHPDGKSIYFTSGATEACGQLVHMDLITGKTKRAVDRPGWATSVRAFGDQIVFISGDATVCPRRPNALEWKLGTFDVFGTAPTRQLQLLRGVAEVGASENGYGLVMTRTQDGDPELYVANAIGTQAQRVTHDRGYDGGATVAPNGSKIAWHAERITEAEREAYDARMSEGRMAPTRLALMVAGVNGEGARTIQHGAFSMSPSFMPDSQRILFSSNADDPGNDPAARTFQIYLVDPDGPATSKGTPRIERVTHADGFDGQMSPDGKYILFTSSRRAKSTGETNVFVARWLAP